MPTLALIHTSAVFLTRETAIQDYIKELLPDVRVINIMDDSLLPDCMSAGAVTPETAARMCDYVLSAEKAGADLVLSLCSSLGPAIDVARRITRLKVIKIDDPHTAEAVRSGRRIGVMATVASTLTPTVALIREKAAEVGKEVEIVESLSRDAFEALMGGDRDRHDAALRQAATELAPKVDVILLAQGSMARLEPALAELTGKPPRSEELLFTLPLPEAR